MEILDFFIHQSSFQNKSTLDYHHHQKFYCYKEGNFLQMETFIDLSQGGWDQNVNFWVSCTGVLLVTYTWAFALLTLVRR